MKNRALKRVGIAIAAIIAALVCVAAIALVLLQARTDALHDDWQSALEGAELSAPVQVEGVEVITLTFSGEDVPYSAFGKYYIRIADEDRELSPSELRKIMIRREYEENWENKTTNQTVDDADEKTVKAFYDSAISCGRL